MKNFKNSNDCNFNCEIFKNSLARKCCNPEKKREDSIYKLIQVGVFSYLLFKLYKKIKKEDSNGGGSEPIPPTPPPPTPPVVDAPDLSLTVESNTSILLLWTLVANATQYNVFRSDDGGVTYNLITTVSDPTNTYMDTGLNPGTEYFYKVNGENSSGTGPDSTPENATTTGINNISTTQLPTTPPPDQQTAAKANFFQGADPFLGAGPATYNNVNIIYNSRDDASLTGGFGTGFRFSYFVDYFQDNFSAFAGLAQAVMVYRNTLTDPWYILQTPTIVSRQALIDASFNGGILGTDGYGLLAFQYFNNYPDAQGYPGNTITPADGNVVLPIIP
jgi:hypothetical protein